MPLVAKRLPIAVIVSPADRVRRLVGAAGPFL